jgi:hypothetical protein
MSFNTSADRVSGSKISSSALALLLKGKCDFSLMEADNSLLMSLGRAGLVLLQIKRGFAGTASAPATSVAELRLDAAKFEADISEAWEDFLGIPFPGFDQVKCFNQQTLLALPTFGGSCPQAFVQWNRGHEPLVHFQLNDEERQQLMEEWEEHLCMLKAFGN